MWAGFGNQRLLCKVGHGSQGNGFSGMIYVLIFNTISILNTYWYYYGIKCNTVTELYLIFSFKIPLLFPDFQKNVLNFHVILFKKTLFCKNKTLQIAVNKLQCYVSANLKYSHVWKITFNYKVYFNWKL